MLRVWLRVGVTSTLLLAGLAPADAQTVRVSGVTGLQYVHLRPLTRDSVQVGLASGDGLIRRTADGRLVRCVSEELYCHFTRSDDRTSVVPLIQDLDVSAWGFGRGIRVYAQMRARSAISGREELWPLADDPFDVLSAFVELDRARFRLRGGRQWKVSGLGYYNFDGASVLLRPWSGVSAEAFGGWSLARGLNEPRTSGSLSAIEQFAPDARALLLGAQVRYRPSLAFGIGALYQREMRDDGDGLYSERVAADASYRWGAGSLAGSIEADLATHDVNDARITANYSVARGLAVNVFGRSYKPFFELWTIWGAFDPVGFKEFGAGAKWQAGARPFDLQVDFSRRFYDDSHASTVFGDNRTDGWSLGGTGSVRVTSPWLIQGTYRIDLGFGASRSQASIRVRRDLGRDTWLAANGFGFERLLELRVAEGTVYGLGLDGRLRLGPRSAVSGSLTTYRHYLTDGQPDVDWSQLRGTLRFEWTVGPEPGMAGTAGGDR